MSTNPYQPPTQFSEPSYPAGPQHPTAATVLGILNILFGVLGLCGLAMTVTLLFVPFNAQMKKDNPALQLMDENAFYRTFNQVGVVLGFVATAVLIAAGVGLLQTKTLRAVAFHRLWHLCSRRVPAGDYSQFRVCVSGPAGKSQCRRWRARSGRSLWRHRRWRFWYVRGTHLSLRIALLHAPAEHQGGIQEVTGIMFSSQARSHVLPVRT